MPSDGRNTLNQRFLTYLLCEGILLKDIHLQMF